MEKVECRICQQMFTPWEDEYGDLEDDWCYVCAQDEEWSSAADGQMGG